MVAPIIGSLILATLGWRASFGALCCLGALALGGAYRHLPESLPPEKRQPRFSRTLILTLT
jgi:MFS transporter, DHA1 family, multidrug resistance protein